MNKPDIETEIQSKGKVAPRVTPEHIENIIVSEHFFTAAQGYEKSCADNFSNDPYPLATPDSLHLLTFCVLVLKNGFTVTGESACASPENFDEEIGYKIARQNAVNKIWMLEGYLLKQKLSDKDNLSEKIQSFMHDYDPAEFGDEESNGGLTYAKHFADALSEKLI
nr:hypothetical protein [Providencia rettgeri]ELR5195436.1 hypothetical protein [Providencia rettgeri]